MFTSNAVILATVISAIVIIGAATLIRFWPVKSARTERRAATQLANRKMRVFLIGMTLLCLVAALVVSEIFYIAVAGWLCVLASLAFLVCYAVAE